MIPIVAAAATRRTWTPGISPRIPSAINSGTPPASVANDRRPLAPANDTLDSNAAFERASRRKTMGGFLLAIGVMAVGVLAIIAGRVIAYGAFHSDMPWVREVLRGLN